MKHCRLLSSLFLTVHASAGVTAVLTPIGDLPGGAVASEVRALSRDGTTAVGSSASAQGTEAIRFRNGSLQSLGDFPGNGTASVAYAVSGDGKRVGGQGSYEYFYSGMKYTYPAFIWTEERGLEFTVSQGSGDSCCYCITPDGQNYAVSNSECGWVSTYGWLTPSRSNNWSTVSCLSHDGRTCFGDMWAFDPNGNYRKNCNRFTVDSFTGTRCLSDRVTSNGIRLCSADGAIGVFKIQDGVYKWTASGATRLTGTQDFDPLAGNDDLSLLGGSTVTGSSRSAAFWTASNGVVTMDQFLKVRFGISIDWRGFNPTSCTGISGNCLAFAGSGISATGNPEGWILNISYDWNYNGIDDAQEIRDGLISDINGNGIADCFESGIECPAPSIAANPGFEDGNLLGECSSELLPAGSRTGAWQVISGIAERANRNNSCTTANWIAGFGNYAIELRSTGGTPGVIRQTLSTEPGRHYRVSFWMSANCSAGETISVRTSAGSVSKVFTSICQGTGRQSWFRYEFDFVAGLNNESLEFASGSQQSPGPVLDAISVSDVTVGCPYDLDGNGATDGGDLSLLLLNFGPCE